ncbi:MAG: hypothetical protein C4576_33550 [Desulfobacteraceae bacterium]|nr:MAG: hypothetical protein C4576_33550 [Desulfobacteraceae bacterium]
MKDLNKVVDVRKLKDRRLFTDENISRLFGHEAADDEELSRLREYYVKNILYQKLTADLKLRLLVGHKGIGKSAMFKIASYEDEKRDVLSVFIRPDDISELKKEGNDFLESIRIWKEGLNAIICKKILNNLGFVNDKEASFSDQIKKYGSRILDFISDTIKYDKVCLDPTKDKIRSSYLKDRKINVYVDDLDRGWQGRKEDINMVSALMNAVRDVSNENATIHFKLALRSDVYYLFRTSDESTDKVGGSVIWLTWTNHEILALLVKRIETFFGRAADENELFKMHQRDLAKYLDPIMEPKFKGSGHWENAPIHRVLMSLIRKRPRDLVKLCTLAAQNAFVHDAKLIATDDWEYCFPSYSNDRLLDTEIEYKSELPQIRRLMLGMKPSVKKQKAHDSYSFSTEQLLAKISSICEKGAFTFANGKEADPQELAHFLYKINFITARRKNHDGEIVRKYFEEHNYLMQGYVDFGFSWEVHPAYRWALQPDDPKNIYQRLEILDFAN